MIFQRNKFSTTPLEYSLKYLLSDHWPLLFILCALFVALCLCPTAQYEILRLDTRTTKQNTKNIMSSYNFRLFIYFFQTFSSGLANSSYSLKCISMNKGTININNVAERSICKRISSSQWWALKATRNLIRVCETSLNAIVCVGFAMLFYKHKKRGKNQDTK